MRAGVAQVEIISPVFFSLCVYDMPISSRHVKLALYADDTAVMSTSRKPELFVRYLELITCHWSASNLSRQWEETISLMYDVVLYKELSHDNT